MASASVTVRMEASPLQQADEPSGPWVVVENDDIHRRYVGVFVTALLPGELSLNQESPPSPNYVMDTAGIYPPQFIEELPNRVYVPTAGEGEKDSRVFPAVAIQDCFAGIGALLLLVGLWLYSVSLSLSVIGSLMLIVGLWSHHSHVAAQPPAPEGSREPVAGHDGD